MNAPLPVQATVSLHDDTKSSETGQYFCNENPFALQVSGNKVERLESGEEAFRQMLAAMKSAQKFIWIADWQMAFDVELGDRGQKDHPGRLIEVIRSIIRSRPVQVRVLLYGSPTGDPVGVADKMVAARINAINQKDFAGKVIVLSQSATSAQYDSFDYSHHQKFMVVDGGVAFIGGIDLSYGRYSTPEFDLVIDPSRFVLNEMYNPGATRLRKMAPHERQLVALGFADPYGGNVLGEGKLLDEGCQPRMPWQDVHMKFSGPAAVDVHRNFVRRWNSIIREATAKAQSGYVFIKVLPNTAANETVEKPSEINQAWLDACGATSLLRAAQTSQQGAAMVQVVRSVSSSHLSKESWTRGAVSIPDDVQLLPGKLQEAMEKSIRDGLGKHQANILNAMVNCIRSADNYIYIETQFFISGFGTAGSVNSGKVGNEDNGIRNVIVRELGIRIAQHIGGGTNFHVYLVLPVHPEGDISSGSVWKQHWLALASIHHGSDSLIGCIKAALQRMGRAPAEWTRYLTVLNMRSYGVVVQYARDPKTFEENYNREIGRYVVTEQIYIHSKLLIVDDAAAIVGSANTNDRSLTGNGDTEIAAVVVDTEGVELKDLGEPRFKVQTRKFARELRRSLWEKHFGFALNPENYFNSTQRAVNANSSSPPVQEHPPRVKTTASAVFSRSNQQAQWQTILDKPCHPDTVRAIQTIAGNNARAYETVFPQVPRNGMKHFDDILKHYTRPYPAVVAGAASKSVQSLTRNRDMVRGMVTQNVGNGISPEAAARMQKSDDEAYRKNIDALPDTLGDSTHGVIPPALGKDYMTSNLMPHQQEGLRTPMEDFANRYVAYEGNQVHDIAKAINYLKSNVLGFFVLMPLNWGEGADVGGGVVKEYSVDLAQNENKASPSTGSSV
ncbi:phospholipase D1/2 [Variovorax boronicumulans]|uniref:phospholipase D-like domain-containing protein n=1 Tax=Variovorax boronicumulans TaxID=436515 RepID=UPI002782C66D|nr:phospholipase D-like domain-containing protein [Variovorax boronicumulans]MDQ0017613.1 phospholipase D1/2 [Variovorax boronicumulans]